MKTVKQLKEEYQLKVNRLDSSIEKIIELIRQARKDNSIDTEDLIEEKANANRDRQIYIQFIKDLEDLE